MDCNRCKKRSLTHIANRVFKDARIAKKWLTSKDEFYFKDQTPIEKIADEQVTNKEDVVLQLYIAAMMDDDLYNRETYEDRLSRLVNTTTLMGLYRDRNHARAMIKHDYMMGESEKISDMLKTRDGTDRFQTRIMRGYYGVYS